MIRQQLSEAQHGIFFLLDRPSDEDDIKGLPLVGSDGHLFSRALRASGLALPDDIPADFERAALGETRRLLWERRAHSFACLSSCGALRDQQDVAEWLTPAAGNLLTASDLRREAEWLCRVRPNVLVPLGETALWSVTGRTSIDDWRGAVRLVAPDAPIMNVATAEQRTALSALKLLPTYPPERVLKQYKLLVPLIADLMKVRHEAASPEYTPSAVAVWLEPNLEDLEVFYRDHVAPSRLITLDIETAAGQIVCVQIGTDARTALVLPFVDYRKSDRSYWAERDEQLAWDWLRQVLDTPQPKLGQNFAAYDAYWLLDKAGLGVRNYAEDLRLIHHILQPELPKSLAFMGSMYTDMPRWKTDVHHGQGGTAEKRDA